MLLPMLPMLLKRRTFAGAVTEGVSIHSPLACAFTARRAFGEAQRAVAEGVRVHRDRAHAADEDRLARRVVHVAADGSVTSWRRAPQLEALRVKATHLLNELQKPIQWMRGGTPIVLTRL